MTSLIMQKWTTENIEKVEYTPKISKMTTNNNRFIVKVDTILNNSLIIAVHDYIGIHWKCERSQQ